MSKENKLKIKNQNTDLFGGLLNTTAIKQKDNKSNLAEILEEITEICSETNEDFAKDELEKKENKE
ncbi:MAG TPA: hypothetical protein PKZ69_06600 [Candidatus Cloacimonadota bacterium]|nr:hypothetical protein [Candidatus Cloacimonadota bacterium]